MSKLLDEEIVAGDPDEPEDHSPAVAGQRAVESATLAIVLAFAILLAWDNWRIGIGWESTGPQAGYFPFYVAAILAGACLFGLAREIYTRAEPAGAFVSRNQFKRVMQVFVPTLLFVPVTQWLGLYVASFALIAGFMVFVGHIKPWKSLLTSAVFTVSMFVTFEVAFDVIMPKGPLERLFGY
ncbi:MAG: tripartite tricarboxylate transporter TctB family protein [Usitatibacter sp.]